MCAAGAFSVSPCELLRTRKYFRYPYIMSVTKTLKSFIFIPVLVFIFIPFCLAAAGKEPITVNGYTVEFKSENGRWLPKGM